MGFDPDKHHRRSIRLPGYDYSRRGAYFVTICAHDRQFLFGEVEDGAMRLNETGKIADECWRAIPVHFGNVELDAFVVMPNHIHGIIVIADVGATHASPLQRASPMTRNGPKRRSLAAIIGSYKSGVSKRINEICATDVGATHASPLLWQRNYYEHIIRDEAERGRVREYIEMNPARWAEDRENPNGATKKQ